MPSKINPKFPKIEIAATQQEWTSDIEGISLWFH
jgi:hypothetical protein